MNKYSNYKGVGYERAPSSGSKSWVCRYKGVKTYHETERESALNYDKCLIRAGKEPVNILKPVKK